MSAAQNVLNRLQQIGRRPDELSPADFETEVGSQGAESVVARLQADTAVALRDGPIKLAVPAYESFTTAGDGTTQTFQLSHSVTVAPDTQDVVIWFDGDYQGEPESIDYDADTITVNGPGSVVTVHTFYVSDEPATVKYRKESPNGNHREPLYEGNAGLVHQTNQNEQPEQVRLREHPLKRFVATDMELQITVDAPYVTRFEDPDGHGATATNALLETRVLRAEQTVPGLTRLVTDAME
jgi:hypothetical protein